MKNRGYFGIGVYHPKTKENIGTLWRSAMNFGASFIFTIGRRYVQQASDTVKTMRSIPLYDYPDVESFLRSRPRGSMIIGVEQDVTSRSITNFVHPEQCVYVLGAEDDGLPPALMEKCNAVVHIDTPMCLNVAVAGSIIMFDRQTKGMRV